MRPSRKLLRIAAGFLALAVACVGSESTAPEPARPAPAAGARDLMPDGFPEEPADTIAAYDVRVDTVTCAPHAPVSSQAVFGPRGGTLVVGGSVLVVPAGALRDTVTITGTAPGNGSSTIRFKPHGLRFRKPAALALTAQGCQLVTGKRPIVVYIDPAGEVQERLRAIYLPDENRVIATIRHFSGYAIAF